VIDCCFLQPKEINFTNVHVNAEMSIASILVPMCIQKFRSALRKFLLVAALKKKRATDKIYLFKLPLFWGVKSFVTIGGAGETISSEKCLKASS
jgi:hypothetical protein